MTSTSMQHSQMHAPPAESDVVVVCRSIKKSFGEGQARVRVLRGTDFDAKAGEMTFLVGPSGCGKTTLISIIGAILSCDGGDIRVLGDDLRRMRNGQLADFRLDNFGFIFQQFNLLPALNAAENAAIPLVARGYSTRKAEGIASEMLEKLGLGEHTRKIPAQLSGGQQQRVAIARALVHSPRIVICDEPTASLDAASGQRVMELLRDAAMDHERAVIVVTHDDRIFRFADRIAHMADGTISKVERGKLESSKTPVTPKDAIP
ncbi:MAG: ABC transporter ATP-binding protein [Phycisphaeraceae bacterium]|nr:MAG: ABC transporter ATP-binding protein [Phycisphaeraceae bacterium]